jgi:hypothetical protein
MDGLASIPHVSSTARIISVMPAVSSQEFPELARKLRMSNGTPEAAKYR